MFQKILLFFFTVQNLRWEQVLFRILKVRPSGLKIPNFPSRNQKICTLSERLEFLPNPVDTQFIEDEVQFNYLNLPMMLTVGQDWKPYNELPLLWKYKFNYLDELGTLHLTEDQKVLIIESWIKSNPLGDPVSWDPYPISLRLFNILKFIMNSKRESNQFLNSLWEQFFYLSESVEKHLYANHIFENYKTLACVGRFLFLKTGSKKVERIYQSSLKKFKEECKEQFLSDGVHFEVSPMYHGILLEGLIDFKKIMSSLGEPPPPLFNELILKALKAYSLMFHLDNKISQLGDSMIKGARSISQLKDYANTCGNFNYTLRAEALMEESGIFRKETRSYSFITDVGQVAHRYAIGHSHADDLTYEVVLPNGRLVVDTGISTYENSIRRLEERSTASHNTVAFDNKSSSEVWSAFRLARKSTTNLNYYSSQGQKSFLKAESKHYFGALHGREYVLNENEISIEDCIDGNFKDAFSFIHFHPEVKVERKSSNTFELKIKEMLVSELVIGEGNASLSDFDFAEDFYVLRKAKYLKIGPVGNKIKYKFSLK